VHPDGLIQQLQGIPATAGGLIEQFPEMCVYIRKLTAFLAKFAALTAKISEW